MHVETLSQTNLRDFYSLFNEKTCKDCYCTALYARSWDAYDPESSHNRLLRENIIKSGKVDGFLCYEANDLIGWVQVGHLSDFPNLVNISDYFTGKSGMIITCFKIKPEYRSKGFSTKMVACIVHELTDNGQSLFAIPSSYSDEFNEFRSWTGTAGTFKRNGFVEVENAQDDYVVMEYVKS